MVQSNKIKGLRHFALVSHGATFVIKEMCMLERTIERKLKQRIKAQGGLALKFVSPGMVGVPDRIVLTPNGQVRFVELKAPGKKPSPKQIKMACRLAAVGHQVWVIDCDEKITEFMQEVFGE